MRGLKDKVALVTGGGGGIGSAICRRLVEEGCAVAIFDVDEAKARDTAHALERKGGRAHAAAVDITDYGAVERGVRDAQAALGPLDILVNNAGWDRFANFLETDPALCGRIIAVNLRGPLNLHHVVLRGMAERGAGRVINIGSDAGRVGSSGEAVYSACKGGVIALTKTLAREMARSGVLLNAVCPGPTETPLFRSFLDEGEAGQKVYQALRRAIPLRRLGEPEDIPGIVAFLASDDARYITGQVVSVSGGLTMHG
jgi:2-hydroxycyclohexanecarboxyl-CoA dehydrogenase